MAQRNGYIEYPRVNLEDIRVPSRQSRIVGKAIKEGVSEIFIDDIDGNHTPALVVLPDRLQANFICTQCMKSVVVKYFRNDIVRGNITQNRMCECGGVMYRKYIGIERNVPLEMDTSIVSKTIDNFLEEQVEEDEVDEI